MRWQKSEDGRRVVVVAIANRPSLQRVSAAAGPPDVDEVLSAAAGELAVIFARIRDTQMILFREGGTDPEMHAMASDLVASTGDLAELLAGAADERTDAAVRVAGALRGESPDPARVEDAVRLVADGLRRPPIREDG
jgi:hypothetical protein